MESAPSVEARIAIAVEAWRARLAGAAVVSPSALQELLFEVYDDVKGDRREAVVTSWLTLTIQRELFSSAEVDELLGQLLDSAVQPTIAGVAEPSVAG